MRLIRLLFGSLAIAAFVFTSAQADTNRTKLAFTSVLDADADFPLQGEYMGFVRGPSGFEHVGLQVIALGDGKFEGVRYPGGLPGSGWNGIERITLAGERRDAGTELTGPDFVVTVLHGQAAVRNEAGESLGVLKQVHRISPTLGAAAPLGAVVLFDGGGTEHFKNGRLTEDGLLAIGTELKDSYRDYTMHVEFRLPYMPHARGQGRANSGVYLQSRYEVQILDSFGLEGKENECASLYRYKAPDINMCFPPLRWQTYDIVFKSPRFDDSGNKVQNARLTVWHNGYPVQNDFEIERKTGAGAAETPELLPTKLQDHGNPVAFRNIWLVNHENAPPQPVAGNGAAYAYPGQAPLGYAAPGTVPVAAPAAVPAVPAAVAPQPGAVVWPPFGYNTPHYAQAYPQSIHHPVPGPAFQPVPPVNYQPLHYPAGHPSTAPYPLYQAFPAVQYQPVYYPPGHPSTVPYPPVQYWQGIYVYPAH